MNLRLSLYLTAAAVLLICIGFIFGFFVAVLPAQSSPDDESIADPMMQIALDKFSIVIEAKLLEASSSLRNHAEKFGGVYDNESRTQSILSEIYVKQPIASSVMLVDADGIIRGVSPLTEQALVGTSDGLHLSENQFPSYSSYMSEYRTLSNGVKAVTYSFPVYTANHTYAGYLSMNIDPNMLLASSVQDIRHSAGYDIWVATSDGTVLYDADTFEVGRNILTDPLYMDPTLYEIATEILTRPSGSGHYLYYDTGWTNKSNVDVVWKYINFTNGEYWILNLVTHTPIVYDRPGSITPEAVAMEQFVYQALLYVREHGKEAALAEFNNPNGTFTLGEYYIYAYDKNGTILSLPYQPKQVGINRYDQVDSNGVKYTQQAIARIGQGGGYMYFPYPNPSTDYVLQMKLGYLLPVDDDWFIGTGVYLPNISVSVDAEMHNALIKQVRSIQNYGQKHGMNATLEILSNPNGQFAVAGLGPFAESSNGIMLANPIYPEYVGINTLGFTDSYGISVSRDVVNLANRGGGMMYASYTIDDPTTEQLCLLYVEPITDDWFVGSGMPLSL